MTSSSEYRDRARICVRLSQASEGAQQAYWLKWAEHWLQLATFAEGNIRGMINFPQDSRSLEPFSDGMAGGNAAAGEQGQRMSLHSGREESSADPSDRG